MRGGLVNLKGLEVHPASGANLYSLTAPPVCSSGWKKGHQVHQVFPPPVPQRFLEL